MNVQLGRTTEDMNPFLYYQISGRASIDTLSEFAALPTVLVGVAGSQISILAGAKGNHCTVLCIKDASPIFVQLAVVCV